MGRARSPPGPPPMLTGNLEIYGHPAWLVGFGALVGLHAIVYILVSIMGGTLAKNPNLAAHFLPQLVGFVALAYYGGGGWLTQMPAVEPDIMTYVPAGEVASCIMISLQLYELAACLPANGKRLRGNAYEMVGHHVITLLLSVLAYFYQSYQYWAPCFMGMSEWSSIPLAFIDLFKFFPTIRDQMPIANETVRTAFALLFLPIRGVYWPYASVNFWRSSLAALEKDGAATSIIYTFCICNVLMTCLQWFWASLILKALYLKAVGDPKHKEA